MAQTDTLSDCFNRRHSMELLERQMKLAKRNGSPLLVAYFDVDNLKGINDRFGHKTGDHVLKEVSHLFKSTFREVDIICRMGGDEFLIVFPDSSLQQIPLIRERLAKKLLTLNKKIIQGYQIELSMGFSEFQPSESVSVDELIDIADRQMYEEKLKKRRK